MAAIAIINGFPTTLPPPPDVDRGSWILPLNWTIRSLAVFVVLARLFTRGVLKRALGWDDVAIAMAAVCPSYLLYRLTTTTQPQSQEN